MFTGVTVYNPGIPLWMYREFTTRWRNRKVRKQLKESAQFWGKRIRCTNETKMKANQMNVVMWNDDDVDDSIVSYSGWTVTHFVFCPIRLLHVWSWSDCGLFQPLLWHLCRHRGQRSRFGRCPERQPLREDPNCGNLWKCHRPVWCHCSYSAGKYSFLQAFTLHLLPHRRIMAT